MSTRMLAVAALAMVAACGGEAGTDQTGAQAAGAAQARPACDADNGGLTLPQGFCAVVVHDGIGPARHITVGPNGDVYVAMQPRRGQESTAEGGHIVALRDTTGDGRADQEVRFGDEGGTGIAIDNGFLYFAPNTYVVRYRLPQDGTLQPLSNPDTVVSGFPEQRGHAAKSIALDGGGNLWVNIGAPSNNCGNPDRQPGARGMDPCPELERQAGVWRFDANRTGQQQADGERWASGIRNAVALSHNRNDGSLYAVQHGRDQLDVVADRFTPQQNAELPAEEFIRLERGSTFAWPYCYYDPQQGRRVLAPEYGGDGQRTDRCEQFQEPLAVYPAHWAPNDLHFYTGSQFPERYRGGAFIAWHGSWNRAPEPQRGYQVTFRPMNSSQPADQFEVFADGFAGQATVASPDQARHRPMGLAEGPDGSLYIVESVQGKIWRVMYTGGR